MSTQTKVWLITAISLILVGTILFGGAMAMFGWDFSKLSTVKYEESKYEIKDDYNDISINTSAADVELVVSKDPGTTVVCYEESNLKHTVAVENGVLTIKLEDTRKWYEHIGVNFGTPKITVYIPKREHGMLTINQSSGDTEIPKALAFQSIDIKASTGDVKCFASATEHIKIALTTGDIKIENTTAKVLALAVTTGEIDIKSTVVQGEVEITASTGDAKLTNLTCNSINSTCRTGDIDLKSVVVSEKLSVATTTGDVKLNACDAAEIFIKTTTGDVKGSLLSGKVFTTKTKTGDISVPPSATGGKCEIVTNTGDIEITVH